MPIAPGLIEKTLPQNWQDTINQLKQADPGAVKRGRLMGTAAQLAIPGLDVVKGAGLLPMAANAAVNVTPYAISSALNKYAETGDVGQAIRSGLGQEALGVGVGTSLGGLGLAFGKVASAAHPILQDVDAMSYGFSHRDIAKPDVAYAKKMGLNPIGYQASQGDNILDKTLSLVKQFGGRGKAGLEKAAQWVTGQYGAVNDLVKASGAKLSDNIPDIMNAPIVQTMKNTFDPNEVDNTINTLVSEADRRIQAGPKGWTQAVDFLNKQQERGIKIGQSAEGGNLSEVTQKANMGELLQDSSSLVKAHLKEWTNGILTQAEQAGQKIPDLDLVDHLYGGYKALQENLARRSGKPMQSTAGGSETTAGSGIEAALGGILGGPAGAAAVKVAGSTALAPLVKRGLGALTNQVMGRSASGIDTLLQGLSQANTTGLAGGAARGIGLSGNLTSQSQPQSQPQPSPLSQDTSGIMPQGPQAAISPESPLSRLAAGGQVWPQIQQPPQSPMDENTMATGRAINDKEQELTTQQVKDAQQTTLTAFDSSIRNKVFRDWSTWQNPFKGDFDSFYAEVYNETNGFDPKNANTARVIAGSDFQNYQKTYQAALEMQSLGKDLTRALSYIPYNGPGGGIYKAIDPEGHSDHERLVNTLWTAMTGESKPPEGKDRDNIESRLTDLRRERLDEGGAKAKLMRDNAKGVWTQLRSSPPIRVTLMMPSADFREELRKVFGVKKPKQAKDPIALPVHDLPKKEDQTKTVGDPMIAYSAQQIYNPQLPPMPPKPPTQVQANRGTVGAMDTTGPWGQPEKE